MCISSKTKIKKTLSQHVDDGNKTNKNTTLVEGGRGVHLGVRLLRVTRVTRVKRGATNKSVPNTMPNTMPTPTTRQTTPTTTNSRNWWTNLIENESPHQQVPKQKRNNGRKRVERGGEMVRRAATTKNGVVITLMIYWKTTVKQSRHCCPAILLVKCLWCPTTLVLPP